jgi:hypothetical protein
MKISFLIDVTPRLAQAIERCFERSHFHQIKEGLNKIMSKLDELQAAIDRDGQVTGAGLLAVADAITELTGDVSATNTEIAALKDQIDNPNVQTQIDTLNARADANVAKFNTLAQAIRDAIPTAAAVPADSGAPTDGATTNGLSDTGTTTDASTTGGASADSGEGTDTGQG